jgi:protein required for attachment to host cells
MKVRVRVIVADESEAKFFDTTGPGAPLAAVDSARNELSRLHDTDLESDREGRGFGPAGQRHGVNGERSTERHEVMNFARAVARRIEDDRVAHAFDRLVLIAGPRMLGLLRQALPEICRHTLAGEVPKDLSHGDIQAIREAIPLDAFFH